MLIIALGDILINSIPSELPEIVFPETITSEELNEIPSAELEVKRRQLEIQKELLMKTKKEVMSKLESIKSNDLKKIYSSLLKDAPKEGKLLCRKQDKALLKSITKLSQSGEIDDLGFIIESGDYRLDYRFSTLVEKHWQDNLPMVSEVLFS